MSFTDLTAFEIAAKVRSKEMKAEAVTTAYLDRIKVLDPKIKAFSPDRIDDAFRYISLPSVEVPAIWIMLRRLRDKLGVANLQCLPAELNAKGR